MSKILGAIILIGLVIGLFAIIADSIGGWEAIKTFVIAIVFAALVLLGICLVTGAIKF